MQESVTTEKNAPITMMTSPAAPWGLLLPNENPLLGDTTHLCALLATAPFVPDAPALSCEKTGLPHGGFWNVNGRSWCFAAGGRSLAEVLCRYLWRICWPARGDLYLSLH